MGYKYSQEAITDIERVTGRQFSEEQYNILNTVGGMSIAAVAGSGKTTVLTALIAKRLLTGEIVDPSKILCCTFSKTGATELGVRLNAITSRLGLPNIKVSTIHSTCYNILNQFGVTVNKLSDTENSKLLQQAVAQAIGKRVYLEQDKLEQLESAISIMDGALMTVDELMQSGKYLLEYDRRTFTEIVDTYRTLKRATGKYTFDDMLFGVYEWLCVAKSDVVLNYVRSNFWYLFLDEFQDTNKVQFEIIKAILGVGTDTYPEQRLVVVGDDDQNVYEWRGTDPRIMINIRSVVDIKKMNLSTNYRCCKNIVDSAMNCVINMGTRQDKTMQAYKAGGRVELLDPYVHEISVDYLSPICRNSRLIADRIYEDIKTGRNGVVGDGHYCIMARTNAEMCLIANMLFRQGIYVKQSPGMKLSNKIPWSTIKKIIELSKPFNGITKLQSVLYQLVPYASNKLESLINEVSNSCQCSIDYAIEYIFLSTNEYSHKFVIDYLIEGNERNKGRGYTAINTKTLASLEYILENMKNPTELLDFANAIRDEEPLKALLTLWNTCLSEQASRMTLALKEYLTKLCEQFGVQKFEQFILAVEQAENRDESAIFDKRVELRTIHGAKGMEWNDVYILNDDNHSFPDLNKIRVLIDIQNVRYEVVKDVVDSERRLHYVAQTRAKNNLYFVCNQKEASVFVEETFGYKFTTSEDSLIAAKMRNAGCNDENGRIIFKACDGEFTSHNLARQTVLI